MEKKYIFLDIDGVLNSDDWQHYFFENDYKYGEIDPDLDFMAVERVNNLIQETNAEIVISSSWRYAMPITTNRLSNIGLKGIEYGKTKDIGGFEYDEEGNHITRGELIDKFLKNNPCSNYVILDDTNDFLPHQQSHFVKTTLENGFTLKNLQQALEILRS